MVSDTVWFVNPVGKPNIDNKPTRKVVPALPVPVITDTLHGMFVLYVRRYVLHGMFVLYVQKEKFETTERELHRVQAVVHMTKTCQSISEPLAGGRKHGRTRGCS